MRRRASQGAGQPVTSADKDAWKLDLSRDGRKLVFAASRAGKEELWEKSLDDGRETLLRPADDLTRYSPRWSRDGLRLAYRRDRGTDPDQVRSFSIVRTPTGGGDEQLVTFPSRLMNSLTIGPPTESGSSAIPSAIVRGDS